MFQSEDVLLSADNLAKPNVREGIEQLKEFSFNDFVTDLSQRMVNFAINVAIALLVFYVGKFLIKRIYRFVATIMLRRNIDHSLTTFVLSFINIVLYFILIITVVGILGIETSSFLALFASAGVAIGMALSGTLQNFAGGVLILLLKPYKIGDYIEAQGYTGTVREIQIFHTLITTPDNKAILIPNGGLSTSSINNWSREEVRRVDWTVSISYGDNVEAAREAILAMMADDERIIKDDAPQPETTPASNSAAPDDICYEDGEPAPGRRGFFNRLFHRQRRVKGAIERWDEKRDQQIEGLKAKVAKSPVVYVKELASSSVDLTVRAWVKSGDYWPVYFYYNELIYKKLPDYGINFPFPQMDVHVSQA